MLRLSVSLLSVPLFSVPLFSFNIFSFNIFSFPLLSFPRFRPRNRSRSSQNLTSGDGNPAIPVIPGPEIRFLRQLAFALLESRSYTCDEIVAPDPFFAPQFGVDRSDLGQLA